MYKLLLEKGFVPIYYTNADWHDTTKCNTRLFYRLTIKDKKIMNIILNVLNMFDERFWVVIEDVDVNIDIEVEENLSSIWVYFTDGQTDNFEVTGEEFEELLKVLPNKYILENCEY